MKFEKAFDGLVKRYARLRAEDRVLNLKKEFMAMHHLGFQEGYQKCYHKKSNDPIPPLNKSGD